MPINWKDEGDSRLLPALIQDLTEKGVTINVADVAAKIGSDCTPKALTHRIAALKKTGAVSHAAYGAAQTVSTANGASKKRTTPPGADDNNNEVTAKKAKSGTAKGRGGRAATTKGKKASAPATEIKTEQKDGADEDTEDEGSPANTDSGNGDDGDTA